MAPNDMMLTFVRERIANLSRRYSHGDKTPWGKRVVDEIRALEKARQMWSITWNKYGHDDPQMALTYYIRGVNSTLRTDGLSKGYTKGWISTQTYAGQILKLTSA